MAETILITGGAGFIGSNFIRYILRRAQDDTIRQAQDDTIRRAQDDTIRQAQDDTIRQAQDDIRIVNLDALTYAGNLENLRDIENHQYYKFIHGRIEDSKLVRKIIETENISGIINFAAESHVDRSIIEARPFIDTNIIGTLTLLEAVRDYKLSRFLQISTDEVYGSLGTEGYFTETTPLEPRSPYSASKASADHLVLSFVNTYGINALITRCSNNYGPYQFPEKLIPLMILNALEEKKLPVYGDGLHVRDWIYVEDHCSAIWTVYQKGKSGEVYNVGGRTEKPNMEIVKSILKILNKPDTLIEFVKDRPGHDRRYAIDCTKIEKELGWTRETNLEDGLKSTIQWYLDNPEWCKNVRSGEYMEYYKKQYDK
jgi:dTDP-glucose 4,6-dehydratase